MLSHGVMIIVLFSAVITSMKYSDRMLKYNLKRLFFDRMGGKKNHDSSYDPLSNVKIENGVLKEIDWSHAGLAGEIPEDFKEFIGLESL